jgi:hypothetical protein
MGPAARGLRVLDLFSGTGSIEKTLRKIVRNVEVVSVDLEPKFKPTICANVLELDYKAIWSPGEFDVVWLSPPCTNYSLARNSVPRDFRLADKLVKRGLEIVAYLKPTYYFMENPRAFLRLRPFMKKYDKDINTVNYCQYSYRSDVYKYPKPTNIWTNKKFEPRVCEAGTRCKYFVGTSHLFTAQKGPSMSLRTSLGSIKSEAVYKVPQKLIEDLFEDFVDKKI